ncbi:AsnC family transcriptional regulator [Candidatus Pacearchaeota archaeon]|nr:AsnC family transcriptional regulator [Candidatus Pacearchaeota archaeon]
MDEKDKKILFELEKNSRIPINKLAKHAGVSKEVANYRLRRFIKNKVILDFYTIINIEPLGFSRYGCLVQLKNVNNQLEKEIIDFLIKHDYVTYLGPIIGKWNMAFDLMAKDRTQLEKIIKEIKSKYHRFIESFIVINSSVEFKSFPLKFLGYERSESVNTHYKKLKIDDKDIKILKLLSEDSRAEYKHLSSKLSLSANAVKYRIKNMEKSGLIQGYSVSIDVRKLGYFWHNIQIKLINEEKSDKIKDFLRNHKNVIYYYKHLGNENWDMDIGIVVRDTLALRQFILDLREEFGEFIKLHDIYANVEIAKSNIAPKGIFE